MTTITSRQARTMLGVSGSTLNRLITADALPLTPEGRIPLDRVEALVRRREEHPFTPVRPAEATHPSVVFGAPLAGNLPTMDHHLRLSTLNGRAEAEAALVGPLGADEDLTGWWEVNDTLTRNFADRNAIIVGVIGGYGIEAAEILEFVTVGSYRQRKAFRIRPLTGSGAEPFLGYFPRLTPTGRYYARAAR